MTEQELEKAVRDIIKELYCREYVGALKVIQLKPVGYQLKMCHWTTERPITFSMETDDPNQFLKFLKEELRTARFHHIDYYTGHLVK